MNTRRRLTEILAFLIDGVFLVAWLLTQLAVSYVKGFVHLDAFDHATYRVFQVLFGIATVIPILLDTYRDIRSALNDRRE